MGQTYSDLEGIYSEYLGGLKTKIAVHQAKRSLDKSIIFNGKGLSTKESIYYLLNQPFHYLFLKAGKIPEYFIGTRGGKVLPLNKTTFEFAKFLVLKKYCHKDCKVVDYNKFILGNKVKTDDSWINHVQAINISDVLLSRDNFESYSGLVSYINGIRRNEKGYTMVYSAYNRKNKKLDIYDEETFNSFSDKDYVKLISVTNILLDLFKNREIKMNDNKDKVLEVIDAEFLFRINRFIGAI